MRSFKLLSIVVLLAIITHPLPAGELPRLKVSDNHRFLQTDDGKPFFWLADTAWELFHRLDREDAIRYLDNRAANGYTVIQTVALAEFEGLKTPNPYGHLPLIDNDPANPSVKEGPGNDYWDHVDFIVAEANRRGMYVGFLPTWGDKWNKKWGEGPEIFTPDNAAIYGEWVGKKYQNDGVIWILGGDRPIESDMQKEIIRAMARGLRAGDLEKHLITFHPTGGSGSSQHFHNDDWLDFNMRQNGHTAEFTGRYDATKVDYDLEPTKPVLDGEPIYEDHPVSFDAKKFGHSIASDVRRPLYWNLFTGAFGHTYGHHSVWQMWKTEKAGINNPLLPWSEAIMQNGALQMKHGKALIESRPFFTRIPDQEVIVTDRIPTSMPGAGRYQFVATRDTDGTYAMVYAPVGRGFKVKMATIKGPKVKAWWFNPRDGVATAIGEFPNRGEKEFMPPNPGEMIDWVLVLDDAAKNYPAPGQKK